jgi:carbon storage regulator CsrA
MLVLSRKSQESVVVGGKSAADRKLVVTVLEIQGGKVRLGFDVDAAVPVHRMEVWERIHSGSRPTRPTAVPAPPFRQ